MKKERRKPLLIYDGDCGFCVYWARYWQKLTGKRVDYAPYQDVAGDFPNISQREFRSAVQYVAPDGTIAGGAEASFLTLSHAEGKNFWLMLYRHLPGFAALAEFVYAFIAAHRPAFYSLTLALWGRGHEPPRYDLVSWFFLRGLGLIYLAAFASFAVQAKGLIGSHGILPLGTFVAAAHRQFGADAYWNFPMIFWLDWSDGAIQAVCWGGVISSLLLTANILPRLNLVLLYVLYLSLFYAGQIFMSFQWDLLLLEAGFLGIILSIATKPGIWLLRWLLFRFMFLSGSVKLLSGDAHWANLSALAYHFQTQPLPTPLAWYAHHLPVNFLMACTIMTFIIELGLPFLIFLPRRLRFFAAAGFLLLEFLISLTGNYNFFNLLSMLLCLALFDDAALKFALPKKLSRLAERRAPSVKPHKPVAFAVIVLATLIAFVGSLQIFATYGNPPPNALRWAEFAVAPWRIVNGYGLFAVMTTVRDEIVIEGSDDGVNWKEYGFKYKPGDVMRPPLWNIPHQPRLDWQMWFAALGTRYENPWFTHFLQRLLQNVPEVTGLLGGNPFAEPHKPPRFVRALLYDYRFSTAEEREATKAWWVRRLEGVYYPEASLK
jgi:predicted DCC family thiol-disulfide oxidoreductase YuxK